MTSSPNYSANLRFWIIIILAVTLGCNSHQLELGARELHTDTTVKVLSILRSWTPDHRFIPQLLLTARLGLRIQHTQVVSDAWWSNLRTSIDNVCRRQPAAERGTSQPPGAADRRAVASRQGQIEGQQPVARGSSQTPGAADRRAAANRQGQNEWQQPNAGGRSRGNSKNSGHPYFSRSKSCSEKGFSFA